MTKKELIELVAELRDEIKKLREQVEKSQQTAIPHPFTYPIPAPTYPPYAAPTTDKSIDFDHPKIRCSVDDLVTRSLN